MNTVKTLPTDVSVQDFLASVEPARRREDGTALLEMMSRITGWPAQMWGPSIVGFGRYAYTYESGHSGEAMVTGFSPRKSSLNLYIMPGYEDSDTQALMARLGKHKAGKSCLYINKLADVDLVVLEDIIRAGIDVMRTRYELFAR